MIRSLDDRVNLVWSFAWQDAGHLVGIGDMDTNRIVIADSVGDLVAMAPNALMGPDSVSLEARRGNIVGLLLLHPTRWWPDCGAVSGRWTGRHLQTRQVGTWRWPRVPFPSDGHWVLNKRGTSRSNRTGITTPGAGHHVDHLYGLFAGHGSEGPAGSNARIAYHVHVFDWDGRLRAVWALDHPASTMAVSGDSLLYITTADTGGIYAYRLPPVSETPSAR